MKETQLEIVNLIATSSIGEPVDLSKLIGETGFSYDSSVYRCAYFKDSVCHGKVSIFGTGKMISIGTRSSEHARRDLRYVAGRLADLGLVRRRDVEEKVQNVVATGELGHKVNLGRLAKKLQVASYEPEQFPGLIYHAPELGGGTVLVFASGKVVFAGLKSTAAIEKAAIVMAMLDSREPESFQGR